MAKTRVQIAVALVLLLGAGLLSLPAAAALLDGQSTENLIFPVHLIAMAALGVAVAYFIPAVAGADATRPRSAAIGAVMGLVAALVSVAVFFLLVSGFSGA